LLNSLFLKIKLIFLTFGVQDLDIYHPMKRYFRSHTIPILLLALLLLTTSNAYAMMGIEEEKKLGEQIVRQIEQQAVLVRDPEIVDYVSSIGHRLLEKVRVKFFEYRFYVIKDEALNAFALPGGHIFVHTGLIETIDSENELACVIAHEIAHVQGRHLARRMDRMKRVNLVTMSAAILGLFLGKGEAGSAIFASSAALGASLSLKYSRADEEEADRRAMEWICAAGYNPMGLVSTLKKMQRYRWLGSDEIPGYLLTHPGTSERITYIQDMYQRRPCNSGKWSDTTLDEHLERIKIKIEIISSDPQPLVKKYRKEAQKHPKDILTMYGLASALLAAKDYSGSIAIYRKITATRPENILYKIDLAKALVAYGRYKEALDLLSPLRESLPSSGRFVLAKAFLETGRAGDALNILKSLEKEWPDKAALYFLLGRCYAAQDRAGTAHYYFFKHYSLIGKMDAARYHKAMAKRHLPPGSKLLKRLEEEEKERPKNGKRNGAK